MSFVKKRSKVCDRGILADQDDAGAFGQQFLGAGVADAAAAAGNDRHSVCETEIQAVLPMKFRASFKSARAGR